MRRMIVILFFMSSLAFSGEIDIKAGSYFQLTTNINKQAYVSDKRVNSSAIAGLKYSPNFGLVLDLIHGDRLFRAQHRLHLERVSYRFENSYESGMTGELLLGLSIYNLRFEKNHLGIATGLYVGKILKRINEANDLNYSQRQSQDDFLHTIAIGYDLLIDYTFKKHSIALEFPLRMMYYTLGNHYFHGVRFTYSFKLFGTKKK